VPDVVDEIIARASEPWVSFTLGGEVLSDNWISPPTTITSPHFEA
jgi:hypothetical protein